MSAKRLNLYIVNNEKLALKNVNLNDGGDQDTPFLPDHRRSKAIGRYLAI